MTTDDFRRLGEDLFGHGWQTRLAGALGVDGSTVRRWVGSAVPVPPAIQAFLLMMADRQRARGALTLERQDVGGAIDHVAVAEAGILGPMSMTLLFPGVERARPMPAIVTKRTASDVLAIGLSAAPVDDMVIRTVHHVVTRHPDASHLGGYADAARRRGHAVATAQGRHHHYSLLVHAGDGLPRIVRQIATHSGVLRTLVSSAFDPSAVGEATLDTLMAHADGPPDRAGAKA